MKSLEEKRDEASIDYTESHKNKTWMIHLFYDSFSAGWNACAKEYEKENAELKRQLEIAKEALISIEVLLHEDYSPKRIFFFVDKALNELSGSTEELE